MPACSSGRPAVSSTPRGEDFACPPPRDRAAKSSARPRSEGAEAASMASTGTEKVVQSLSEAHAPELALVRTLQAHAAMTPRGDYRKLLERHLRETRQHAERVERRLEQLGESRSIVQASTDVLQSAVGQIAALGKAPMDLMRGESGEEQLVKNAKDECATEALEIATYDALEALARELGDQKTAELAASIREDEERTLGELRALLPELTKAAARAQVVEPSYDA